MKKKALVIKKKALAMKKKALTKKKSTNFYINGFLWKKKHYAKKKEALPVLYKSLLFK